MKRSIKVKASRKPVAASEYRMPGSNSRMVGANGEINASSRKDLWKQNINFIQAAAAGQLQSDEMVINSQTFSNRNRDLLQAAFNDKDSYRLLGEKLAESLYLTCNRQGFLRNYLARIDVAMGTVPRFPMRNKDVTAVYSTSPTQTDSTITRDRWFYPPEFQVLARPFIPENEINQSSDDVLQEKYVEATEAIMVAEDRLLYNASKDVVGLDNNLSIISGTLSPYTLAQSLNQVQRWGLKAPHILMATDFMQDVIGNSEFQAAIDPVARHELLLTGALGTLYGALVTSDAYRHPQHKVLSQGEFFVYADAINLGAYSDRNGLQSAPTDIVVENVPGRGWAIWESFAMVLANSRGVSQGYRV